MKRNALRAWLALGLCLAMLLSSFALAEESECTHESRTTVTDVSGYYYKWDDPNVDDPASYHAVYAEN